MESKEIKVELLEEFVVGKTGHSLELVSTVLEAEQSFLESKGLILEEKTQENSGKEPVVIDEDELTIYISRSTAISEDIIDEILKAEEQYLIDAGIIEIPQEPSTEIYTRVSTE